MNTTRSRLGVHDTLDEFEVPEDYDDDLPGDIGQYLTRASSCGTIEAHDSEVGEAEAPPSQHQDETRRNKMATTQTATGDKDKAKEAAARAKAAADKAKEKDAADKAKKLEAEKAKKEREKAAAEKKAKAEAEKKERAETRAKEAAAKKAAAQAEKTAKAAAREAERARKAAERAERGLPDRLVPADLTKYHKDTEKKTAGGNVSVDIGDELATKLRGMTLDQVYKEAAKVLKEPEADLRAKYAHLKNSKGEANVGMIRMNLGNRMRAAGRKPAPAPAKPVPAKAEAKAQAKPATKK